MTPSSLKTGRMTWRIWLTAALLGNILSVYVVNAAEPTDFPITTLSGEQQRLSDYRGRWVIVNYWATWCPPCRKELPELDLFNESHKNDAVVLGINFEDISMQALQQFIDQQFLSYPMFHQRPSRYTGFGRLNGLPTTFVLDPEGHAVAMQAGGVTADMLDSFIKNYRPEEDQPVSPAAPENSAPAPSKPEAAE